MKYLYGASIQGIQSFILQTNQLKEIVGASELVEQICTTELTEFSRSKLEIRLNEDDYIIKAAGNIKYLFQSEADCRAVVRHFPKHIANKAPGITLSQAVVKVSDEDSLYDKINELEHRLKTQRSKVSMPVETGFMGLNRDRRTGGVAFEEIPIPNEKSEYICEATYKKRKKAEKTYESDTGKVAEQGDGENSLKLFTKVSGVKEYSKEQIPLEMDGVTTLPNKSWIAIVHADGNGLGMLLQKLGESLKGKPAVKVKEAFATFSRELDTATQKAARMAFDKVIKKEIEQEAEKDKGNFKYPIRPVLLGGDDLTIIIRADLALDFTVEFLKAFESQTAARLKFLKDSFKVKGFENGLTACAGIAFIKKSYPFHYGLHLAEELTRKGKNLSKSLTKVNPPSSLSFYKVQSSFIEDLKEIEKKTLTATASRVSLDYGPYLIHPMANLPCVDDLKTKLGELSDIAEKNKDSKGISKLRKWVAELYKDKSTADFMFERMIQVDKERHDLPDFVRKSSLLEPLPLPEEESTDSKSPIQKTVIYDLLQLHSLKY
jgi:hypothetical protein